LSILDLFAGPGGWDLAARELGIDPLGIEWDDAACATREAAGLRTLQADVAGLDTVGWQVDGLIASPPCQAYSAAGRREGQADVPLVLQAIRDLVAGRDTRGELRARCRDQRSLLVVEPLRWALALEPAWIALEQVPPVLPLWEVVADVLRERGYSVWTGILEAERYGVPQTRERAILMASRARHVEPPQATHQRYVPGEPARHDHTLEGEVLPWVSMGRALGWVEGEVPAPAPTVSGGGTEAGGGVEVFAGRDARRRAALATSRGAGLVERYGDRPARQHDEPAFTVTGKTRSAEWVETGNFTAVERDADGARSCPSRVPASTAELQSADWPAARPATTIAGDSRVFQPGGHHTPGAQSENAVRVTVEEAAVLQTFPPDYPWQGSRSAQFTQVGNAVPPLLARAVLSMLIDPAGAARVAA